MSFKCTFIGAGSVGFTRKLVKDLLSVPEFEELELAFHDIHPGNLEKVRELCQQDIDANGRNIQIQATTDRREAIRGARYIFVTVRVGGLEAFRSDVELPLEYGIDQCVGDTLCVGGLMYAQRGIPVLVSIAENVAELAEEGAVLMNYANPMAMLCWAANQQVPEVQTIGLCHGVQHGHYLLAEALGIPREEVDFTCVGINHQTWYTRFSHRGEDLCGRFLEALEAHPTFSVTEKVRIDMLRRFGYFSTESNGHLSEYVPWYRKRPEAIADWIDTSSWINGETGGYLRHCKENHDWERSFQDWLKEEAPRYAPDNRSDEHGSWIVEALETGRPYRGHFNKPNRGILTNLPEDCIIEAPGYVDRNGIQMNQYGELPLGCAAVCNSSVQVQRLGVQAALTGNDQLLRQAMLLDPLTGAVCQPDEIWQLCDELLVAQAQWLPQYGQAIQQAEARLADTDKLLPVKRGYRGAVRLEASPESA